MSVTLLCLRALKGSGQARQVVAFSADFAAATAFSHLILCLVPDGTNLLPFRAVLS